jgi:hypothetical protein
LVVLKQVWAMTFPRPASAGMVAARHTPDAIGDFV